MRVVEKQVVLDNNSNTITENHLGQYLAKDVHNIGMWGRKFRKDLSIMGITEGLGNVHAKSTKGLDQYTQINKMAIQWQLDVNNIHKVYIVASSSLSGNPGAQREIFTVYFGEKYFNFRDVFALENGTQLRVVAIPKRMTANKWAYKCVLVSDNLDRELDTSALAVGKWAIYRTNYFPELSERGFTHASFNTEIHRNFISFHRHSDSISQQANAVKEKYLEVTEDDDGTSKNVYYKYLQAEKKILDQYLTTREGHVVFGESNFDSNGVCLDQDDLNQDLPMGDGLLEQVYKFASRSNYAVMDIGTIKASLNLMSDKSDEPTGNTFVVVGNKRLFDQINDALLEYSLVSTTNPTFLFSETGKDNKVEVGATFSTYEYGGNKIVFMVNKELTQSHPNYGFGVMLDMEEDIQTNRPAIQSFTLEGSELLTGFVPGLGGKNGKSSGMIATGMTGTEFHIAGYSGIVVFNPYRSHVFEQNHV